jgi:hypothetical protein
MRDPANAFACSEGCAPKDPGDAIAKTVAELTSKQDGVIHHQIRPHPSTIMQWRQGRSCSFSGSAMTDFPLGPNYK